MPDKKNKPKIGAGHASAMLRQGLAELRAAIYPQSNVAQPTVYGIWGTKTPGEVMEERQGEARDPDEKPSLLEQRLEEAKGIDKQDHSPDGRLSSKQQLEDAGKLRHEAKPENELKHPKEQRVAHLEQQAEPARKRRPRERHRDRGIDRS